MGDDKELGESQTEELNKDLEASGVEEGRRCVVLLLGGG